MTLEQYQELESLRIGLIDRLIKSLYEHDDQFHALLAEKVKDTIGLMLTAELYRIGEESQSRASEKLLFPDVTARRQEPTGVEHD